jgi:diadenosine tetraphosphate (Ap4A) HIT family hydrolase
MSGSSVRKVVAGPLSSDPLWLASVTVMTTASGCYTCAQENLFDQLSMRERIAFDEHWRVAHAIGTALEAWLVLVPRRRVITVAELTDAEADRLGAWQVRLSRALHRVTGCAKTYVVQFAEVDGFAHVHFHVIPRLPDLPQDRRGTAVFSYLARTQEEQVTAQRMDSVSESLQRALQR